MKTPFVNDPFALLLQAFNQLYPDISVECYWTDLKNKGYGYTNFCDDGSVEIHIDPNHTVMQCIDTLAHELIHASLGLYHDHDQVWSDAFDKLHDKYDELCIFYGGIK